MWIAILCTELTEQLWRSNGANRMNQIVFKDRHKDFPRGRTAESILGESVPGFCFPNVIFLERISPKDAVCWGVMPVFFLSSTFRTSHSPLDKIKRFTCPHLIMYLAQSPREIQGDHSKHWARLTLFWSRQQAPKAGLVFFSWLIHMLWRMKGSIWNGLFFPPIGMFWIQLHNFYLSTSAFLSPDFCQRICHFWHRVLW